MKGKMKWLLLTAGVLFLFALPSAAQMEKGLVEVSPMVGYQWQRSGIPLKDGYQTALSLGYCFSNNWEGEFQLAYGKADQLNNVNTHISSFRANLLYNWNLNKVSPFVKIGLGKLDVSPNDITDAIPLWQEETTAQLGGGFRYFFSPNLALRAEAGITYYLTSRYFEDKYWPTGHPYPYDMYLVKQSNPYSFEALIGLSFFFHRPAPPPPPPAPTVHQSSCDKFAAGSARIDNRCKAVLDDIAVQMRSNPGATLVVTGYDSAKGKQAKKLAATSAENAKTYLVTTHQIEASRITVESASGTEHKVDYELTIP